MLSLRLQEETNSKPCIIEYGGTGNMAHWVEMLAAKPNHLNWIARTHVVAEDNWAKLNWVNIMQFTPKQPTS